MPQPFRLYRRSNGTCYLEDGVTRKQTSLRTKTKSAATQRLAARAVNYRHRLDKRFHRVARFRK